ncbi:UDP-N-acetylmuramoyl-tripeptide--D-alanyl-D-alanine ligase [Flavimaricola marinus]|uniref:UDP-N-acetylmuramoyl-tripeptide--D-alanyl-D-alanine ligase n=1 Tax=Flavimaricola marinus TaxID=1819565 RepID=A0A238LFP4_9RHOB|nr:UDP-N-acetylmuramoyl-tripeptide--D-alanyl-D-alanine ligase [Flavimaricola marinus]SMY07710.1 UDP-N-acetylmuramoyl-tripeptide--D-alanyl-D-alanine ligase [Flavimaricola marinus]
MTPLWTSADADAATGGRSTRLWQANGVSIDTRTLQQGDLFVALKAARDGHDFVAQALAGGAAAALVTHRPEGVAEDAPLLIVPDVLQALEALGQAARARTSAKVVAITGSVGKTSTKEMFRAALSGQGRTHAAEASYNNHWGVPLTLARMPADTEFAILEIGMNHPGEIAPLARMARPHVVMITTVAAAHLEAFENLDGIAVEKGSICEGLEPHGVAVVNGDVEQTGILQAAGRHAGAKVLTFGESEGADYRLADIVVTDVATVGAAKHDGTEFVVKVSTPGRHFAMNALGVLAAATAMGADTALTLIGLASWQPPAGRGNREKVVIDPLNDGEVIDLIDDAFNANPTSLGASLVVLAVAPTHDGVGRVSRGRRVAILGDMLELGPEEMRLHADLANLPALRELDMIHCVGPRMRQLYDLLPEAQRGRWAETAEAMLPQAARLVDSGDVVLVKGSKGSRVSLIVDAIRKLGQRTHSDDQGA